jgi:ribonuclease HI
VKPLIIYTDGSCLGNPGAGGWAAIIQDDHAEVILSGNETKTTNNRMEMMAIIQALKWVREHYQTDRKTKLYSDSSLIINTLNDGWKRKANTDLWADLDTTNDGLNVEWNWVKGHANNPLNERCDQLAVKESEKAQKATSDSDDSEVSSKSMRVASHSEGQFLCAACGTSSPGLLGYMEESDMIRVDCPHCGRYIKFASPTPENLERAKKRPLISKEQIAALQAKAEADGKTISDRELKQLKKMTQAEAEVRIEAEQTLF